jgi:hypothetical protein
MGKSGVPSPSRSTPGSAGANCPNPAPHSACSAAPPATTRWSISGGCWRWQTWASSRAKSPTPVLAALANRCSMPSSSRHWPARHLGCDPLVQISSVAAYLQRRLHLSPRTGSPAENGVMLGCLSSGLEKEESMFACALFLNVDFREIQYRIALRHTFISVLQSNQ